MDKWLKFPGINPNVTVDSLDRNAEANLKAINGICAGFAMPGSENFLIEAVFSYNAGVDASISAGYVRLNGEVVQVDEQLNVTETEGTDLWEIQKVTTYDSAGDRTYNDGTPRQTYQVNRAVIVNVASISGVNAATLKNVNDVITPYASESEIGKAGIAWQEEAEAGTDNTKIMTPTKVADFTDRLKFHKVIINGWDMDTDQVKHVAAPGLDSSDIVFSQAYIWNDIRAISLPLTNSVGGALTGGISFVDSLTVFVLERTNGGYFDSTDFDDDTIDRGYIIYATLV